MTNTEQRKNLPILADYHSAEEDFALTKTAQKKTLRRLSERRGGLCANYHSAEEDVALTITAQRRTLRGLLQRRIGLTPQSFFCKNVARTRGKYFCIF